MQRERGLIAIITYKLVKGGAWLVLAAVLALGTRWGVGGLLLRLADQLRHHAQAWSIALAKVVVRAATRRGLWTIAFALVADGTSSLIEGWALLRGHWWGPWLVVVSTGSLLPFEVVALARHAHLGRVALLAVNCVIVFYLARKAMRDRHERADVRVSRALPGNEPYVEDCVAGTTDRGTEQSKLRG
ncbi:MAG: DUF2127 domain-containing protein [Polyangiaceae bacterium]